MHTHTHTGIIGIAQDTPAPIFRHMLNLTLSENMLINTGFQTHTHTHTDAHTCIHFMLIPRKSDFIHHHHHPEGVVLWVVVYRSLCLNFNTFAVSGIASRRWWGVASLFPVPPTPQVTARHRQPFASSRVFQSSFDFNVFLLRFKVGINNRRR